MEGLGRFREEESRVYFIMQLTSSSLFGTKDLTEGHQAFED
jgi:hypothetical protein